jgi:electron transfer flavoprotein beta subunit
MELIVCVKQVPDPEASPASFRIDPAANQVVPAPDVANVLSTFDEIAVEAALRVKEAYGGTVTALSLGDDLARDVVKKPLGMGADRLILLEDEAYVGGDSWSTAHALAAAVRKIGTYDLIFCGRQAADWDAGQVGLGVAELLGIPSVSLVKAIDVADGTVRVERVVADGFEVVEAPLPCLVTLTNEFGEPRYASLRGIMKAEKIEPIIWKPEDLGIDPSEIGARGRKSNLLRLFQPVREGECEIIEGENDAEAAVHLALRLREAKIL